MKGLITDEEILNFLMTSDFTEGFTQEEYRFLLLKFRYHYRMFHAQNQRLNYQIQELKDNIHSNDEDYQKLLQEIKNLNSDIKTEKNRKLTLKERLTGRKSKKI